MIVSEKDLDVQFDDSFFVRLGLLSMLVVYIPNSIFFIMSVPILTIRHPVTERTGKRSTEFESTEVEPLYSSKRVGPQLTMKLTKPSEEEIDYTNTAKKTLFLWQLLKFHATEHLSLLQVPDLPGFISEISEPPKRLTTIEYYPVMEHPITDDSTVKECLRRSDKASEEVGQKYTISTFDLDAAMRALPIVWRQAALYQDHIILPGVFHIMMGAFKMLMNKMKGSGIIEIMIEAKLMTSGTVKGITSGKSYYRAMDCHFVMGEALSHLLMERYFNETGEDSEFLCSTMLTDLENDRTTAKLKRAMSNEQLQKFMTSYNEFEDKIRDGKCGLTPQYWLQYLDIVRLIELLQYAVKKNDWNVYTHCLLELTSLFFAYNGHNYARYLSFFSVFLMNIADSHPGAEELLKLGAISVARSFLPGNREETDKVMEETMNRHGKSHGGPSSTGMGLWGIMLNLGGYQRWTLSQHERLKFVSLLEKMTTMERSERINRHLSQAALKRSSDRCSRMIEAFASFMNPFDEKIDGNPELSGLYVLSSGEKASDEIARSVISADKEGQERRDSFIAERLVHRTVDFFDKITKMKLNSLDEINKVVKVTTLENKLVEVEQQSSIAYTILHKVIGDNLKDVMTYPLMPVPSALGTPDGNLHKTNKAKLMENLLHAVENATEPDMSSTLFIEDGNAVYHQLLGLPPTYNELCIKVFDKVTFRRKYVVFCTDTYKPDSIKTHERNRRGVAPPRLISGSSMLRPTNMAAFLSNAQNKTSLTKMILNVWRDSEMAHRLREKIVVLVVDGEVFELCENNGDVLLKNLRDYSSNQEEFDSRMVLFWKYAEKKQLRNVVIKTPDSDVFFIALHHAKNYPRLTILLDIKVRTERRLINISALAREYGGSLCTALMSLHAFTRCDTTSAFKGIGKIRPLKKMLKHEHFIEILSKLGDASDISVILPALEAFTCQIYRETKLTSVNELRYVMLEEMIRKVEKMKNSVTGKKRTNRMKIDISRLPPPLSCLTEHLKRTNYQIAVWKASDKQFPCIPTDDNGWIITDDTVQPRWCSSEIIPNNWLTILEKTSGTHDINELADLREFRGVDNTDARYTDTDEYCGSENEDASDDDDDDDGSDISDDEIDSDIDSEDDDA